MYRLMDGIEFLKNLPDKSVDGIFTDPPWLIKNSEGNHDKRFSTRAPKLKNQERWEELLSCMDEQAIRVLRPETGRCFIWLGMTSVGRAINALKYLQYRFMFFCYYIPPRYIAGFECSMDAILYLAPPSAKWPNSAPHGQRRIRQLYQNVSTGASDTLHPCARPFSTVKQILHDLFEDNEYVIDPFAGSDTTGRAARELGFKWDSCEIDPKMYETGIKRHSQGLLFENI